MTRVFHDQFDAMGSTVEVVMVGGRIELLDHVRDLTAHLEQRWSRFLADSDLSRINAAEGARVTVHADTLTLLMAMRLGVQATEGAFDPTVLSPNASDRSPLEALRLDEHTSWVAMPPGVVLDPGGIGKGLAGDLLVQDLLRLGARGALVSVGGDVRVAGRAPQDGGWLVDVAHATDDHTITGRLCLTDGGVATSGTRRRRLVARNGRDGHHLLHPATGTPVDHNDPASPYEVTVVAGTAAWAEVWTKYVFVHGVDRGLRRLDQLALPARALLASGAAVTNDAWDRVAVPLTSIGAGS